MGTTETSRRSPANTLFTPDACKEPMKRPRETRMVITSETISYTTFFHDEPCRNPQCEWSPKSQKYKICPASAVQPPLQFPTRCERNETVDQRQDSFVAVTAKTPMKNFESNVSHLRDHMQPVNRTRINNTRREFMKEDKFKPRTRPVIMKAGPPLRNFESNVHNRCAHTQPISNVRKQRCNDCEWDLLKLDQFEAKTPSQQRRKTEISMKTCEPNVCNRNAHARSVPAVSEMQTDRRKQQLLEEDMRNPKTPLSLMRKANTPMRNSGSNQYGRCNYSQSVTDVCGKQMNETNVGVNKGDKVKPRTLTPLMKKALASYNKRRKSGYGTLAW